MAEGTDIPPRRKKVSPKPALPRAWRFDPQHDGAREVYCTGLRGIMATPYWQQLMSENSIAAIEFAVSFAEHLVHEMHKRMAEG